MFVGDHSSLDDVTTASKEDPMMIATPQRVVGLVLMAFVAAQTALAQECSQWADVFPSGDMQGSVSRWIEFDDGSGPALYAGGGFRWPSQDDRRGVLRYRNGRWEPVGDPDDLMVKSLALYDDGNGIALYSAYISTGGALPGVSRWNGSTWDRVGQFNGVMEALAVFDGKLYAAGEFTVTGGISTARIASWDGQNWAAVGGGIRGLDGPVYALGVFDDGSGEALYVGGKFDIAGTTQAVSIARWDGVTWADVPGGLVRERLRGVTALYVHNDGSGNALYVGGQYISAGGLAGTSGLARWDGQSWSSVGGGAVQAANTFMEYDDGNGPKLYAGAGGNGLSVWDGVAWAEVGAASPLGRGTIVSSMGVFDDGQGSTLFCSGRIASAGALTTRDFVMWDGVSWSTPAQGIFDRVEHFAGVNEVGGPALYVGGRFQSAGNIASKHIIKWDGTAWTGLAGGTNDRIFSMVTFDDGSGPALFASGDFTEAGGVPVNFVAKWDGQQWRPLGPGLNQRAELIVFDDGTGPALYASGLFTVAGLVSADGFAKWNGIFWSAVTTSATGGFSEMATFADGTGEVFYGAQTTGGVLTIHQWDGTVWTPTSLGSVNGSVEAMTVWDDGGGPKLYIGGTFTVIGTGFFRGVARWDGNQLSSLGTGLLGHAREAFVFAMNSFEDGGGTALYVGGFISDGGGVPVSDIAKWDGNGWSDLGGGAQSGVYALNTFDFGNGSSLYAGGDFRAMSGVSSDRIARLDAGPCPCYADCDQSTGVGVLDIFDFLCFQDSFVNSDPYACDCDITTGTSPPVCDIFDFLCFQNQFVAGCA
jgi:hypothetical protein